MMRVNGECSVKPAASYPKITDLTPGCHCWRSRAYHRSIRNVWYPAFFSESLEGFSAHMNEGAERLIRRLAKAAAREQEIDIWIYLGRMTMDVVGVSSFG